MILKPIQLLYEGLSNLKNFLYNYNFIKKTVIGIPVLSVGNLSVGGTGKTPCVCFLAQTLLEKKMFRSIGIVSRSYKTALKSPQKVDLTRPQAAQIYGDEPCLLQKKLPACSVWSGPQKYLTAKLAVTQETFDLIIVDDGFSHRKLHRHFDLVLIDVTAPLSEYQVLPQGRLREPLSQLHRAHALLLTKTNLVEQSKTQQIIDLLLQQKNISKQYLFSPLAV